MTSTVVRSGDIPRERILERLVATTQQGYWLIDGDGYTLDVNEAMGVILDRSSDEIIGRTIYDFVDADGRATFQRQVALRRTGATGPYEVSLVRSDGALVPCINNATPIYDDDGQQIGSVGLWTDISDIKDDQAALVMAREDAERANMAKSEFLASMSHEFRTPMNAILGFAQLLDNSPNEPLTGSQKSAVGNIMQGGELLLGLIDQVLDLAKIESGEFGFSPEYFMPADVLAECLELVRPMADEKAVTLSGKRGEVDGVIVDRSRFKQICVNLLSNAIKYNVEGGSVSFGCLRVPGGKVRIFVSDTGMGVPVDDQDRLFVPFDRLGRERSNIEGSGVGLAISKRLVEAMGGELGFESIEGSGSTFWVEFPERADDGAVKEQIKAEAAVSTDLGVSGAILYVEDNPANLALMREILRRFDNVEMISAETAEFGLELARQHEPDLIFMDINLPGMDGYEALRILRAEATTVSIPVVALTAAAMKADVARGLNAGFDHYVTKPVEVPHIMHLVARYLPPSNRA